MKILELITEAHHATYMKFQYGPWRVELDTHLIASQLERKIQLADITNIIDWVTKQPDILSTIPLGRGAFFQDVRTAISIYFSRLEQDLVRVETVLPPTMKPKPPLFRRPVPPHDLPPLTRQQKRGQDRLTKMAQQQGRDAVSQHLASMKPTIDAISQLNRSDRRAFKRSLRRPTR